MPYRFIPKATREKLENPAPVGQRHKQIVDIIVALTAHGWPPDEIFDRVRPNYIATGPDAVPDDEIWDVIHGAEEYELSQATTKPPSRQDSDACQLKEALAGESVENRVKLFVGNVHFTDDDFRKRSWLRRLKPDQPNGAIGLIWMLFKEGESVNVVAKHELRSDGKAVPIGYGISKTREEWRAYLPRYGPPSCDAGAWIRMNPPDGRGIGNDNVTAFRYALVESDVLAPDLQLALLAKLPLPIAAVVSSGGKSYHAWVKLDARDASEYSGKVRRLFDVLAPFGVDNANKNPSRLSRLPGVIRKIGATGSGDQNLIFLMRDPQEGQVIANLPLQEDSNAP